MVVDSTNCSMGIYGGGSSLLLLLLSLLLLSLKYLMSSIFSSITDSNSFVGEGIFRVEISSGDLIELSRSTSTSSTILASIDVSSSS